MITLDQSPFEKLTGQYSTQHVLRVRQWDMKQDECVCDTGAILSDRQEALGGQLMGKMGAGD